MLIDNYLPKYDERVRHQTRVAAATAEAYAALRAVDVHRSMVVRMLVAIRRLPSHVGVREHAPRHLKSAHSLLDSMLDMGWEILEEKTDREVVIGTVTQPWRSAVQFRGLTPSEFVAFEEPGFAKIVMNLARMNALMAARFSAPRRGCWLLALGRGGNFDCIGGWFGLA